MDFRGRDEAEAEAFFRGKTKEANRGLARISRFPIPQTTAAAMEESFTLKDMKIKWSTPAIFTVSTR